MRLSMFLLATACSGGDNPLYPPALPLDAAYTTCTEEAECAVVELGCCDHCNGGVAVGVNLDSVTDVEVAYGESCDATVTCTLLGCAPLIPVCQDTVCGLVEGTL